MKCPEYVWCLIPVYNHSSTLRKVAESAKKICPNIIVVNDGSTDGDISEILSGSGITLLKHDRNKGKGAALRTGAEYILNRNGKYIITLDADGQHNPEDIRNFLPYLAEKADTLIIGNRCFDSENIPGKSRFGRKFSNFWINFETGSQVLDSQSGFRAYPAKLLCDVECISNHYAFETEIIVRAAWGGYKLKNVDISVYYPEKKNRITHFRPFMDNFRISLLHSRLTAEKILFHLF